MVGGAALRGAVVVALAAFGSAAAEPNARPAKVMAETFKTCRWGQVTGRTLSIWSYACGKDMGGMRLVADERVRGFAIASAGAPQVVIRTFAKPAAAPVASILPTVLRASGRHDASCRLVEHRRYGDWGRAWLLEPTGAAKRAYDAANAREPQEDPCGELGIGPAGDRFFRLLPGDSARVIYSDMGSELQIFDLGTLRPRR